MRISLVVATLFVNTFFLFAQQDSISTEKVPFESMDMTWQNGNDRRDHAILQTKYLTGNIIIDGNYTYSFRNPIDNTVVGSTALARHNEIQISCAAMEIGRAHV